MLYVVDDELEFTSLLKELPSPIFQSLIAFNDSTLFLDTASLESDDIVILDLQMPQMDGVEIIRNLSTRSRDINLILISGMEGAVLNSTSMLASALGFNVIATFSKPFKLEQLLKVVAQASAKIKQSPQHTHYQDDAEGFSKHDLCSALKNNEFVLFYQPQIDLQSLHICGMEALIRWQHPQLGMLAPDRFLEQMKSYDLLDELTDFVIEETIKTETKLNKEGIDICASINISASSVINLSLPEKLENLISDAAITPSRFCLEVTESELMTELVPALDTLTRMRLKGFNLSIDDFGTGFSSLQQLHRIPFTELKIDRSFVSNLMLDSESQVIVEACIFLAHKLGMSVVAEGIEDEQTVKKLVTLGCDVGQGYYFAKPMPEHALFEWIKEHLPVDNTVNILRTVK
ncbi:EAL domain-containing response regulator [Pseudoalteromonas sp. SSDWG2]|uniref:EAL domain-containing response regulator n=1 Tax=Pseudoalteromonas sp. SSDWG2 TaxID=3139391 RepID=UPI003BAA9EE9